MILTSGMYPFSFVLQVYVLKRPYVDEFLQKMGELFECVLFTASLAKVNDPQAARFKATCIFCQFPTFLCPPVCLRF